MSNHMNNEFIKDGRIRVRFAPSPTGHLHIGGARTALFNWLYARGQGGSFILRFEDTDQARNVEQAEEKLLRSLAWLGIDADESVTAGGAYGPYRQTERLHLYEPFVARLLAEGHAYYCTCTEEQLAADREAQLARGETPKYVGRCRPGEATTAPLAATQPTAPATAPLTPAASAPPNSPPTERVAERPLVLRFRVPEGRTIVVEDAVRGRVEFDSDGIGDFIIARPDGIPMYNFAVVLDDYLMGITHILRGEEHLSNTPRQVLIYEALGLTPPQFAHISLILNQDRQKMSKRDESIIQFVEQYRELGYLPEAILNFLALLGWSPDEERELFSRDEIIARFSLDRIAKNPAVFDIQKLNWMSNEYMKHADPETVLALVLPHLEKRAWLPAAIDDRYRNWLKELVALYQEQLSHAAQFPDMVETFFVEHVAVAEDAQPVLTEPHVPLVLQAFAAQIEQSETWTVEQVAAVLKQVQQETGCKGKQLFMPVRVALTGQAHGRDLNRTIVLLGRSTVLSRLTAQLAHT